MNDELRIKNRESGSVLLLAMLILSSVLAASTAVGTLVVREIRANRQVDDAVIAYYAAESATEKGLWLQAQPGATLAGLQETEKSLVANSTTSPTVARQATKQGTTIVIPLIPQGKSIIVDLYNPASFVDGVVTGNLGAGVDTLSVVKSGGALTITCQARQGSQISQTVQCPAALSQTMSTDTWMPTLVPTLAYRFTLTAGTADVRNVTFSGTLNGAPVILPTPLTIAGRGALPSSRQGVGASIITASPF